MSSGFFQKIGESQQLRFQAGKTTWRIVDQFRQTRRTQVERIHISNNVPKSPILIKALTSFGGNDRRAQPAHLNRHLAQ